MAPAEVRSVPQVGERRQGVGFMAVLAVAASLCAGSEQKPASSSPQELVRQATENEIRGGAGGIKLTFKDHKETPHGSQVNLLVETSEGTAGLLIELNGKALTSEQRAAEEARLNALLHNPAELRRKQKAEREENERTDRIMKALPEAFLYELAGTERGREGIGCPGDELVRLRFRANPNYVPPSRTEQVLTGMQGSILIDASKMRMAKIDGTLFKDVSFGWGILGRLDKGGRFTVEQGGVAEGTWEITHMEISFTGKELLFKKLLIKSNEFFADFRPAPPHLTFAQGVEFLEKQPAALVEPPENGSRHHDAN
ncbi:MAG TPA: hypothetical protein VEK33_07705 [Terriglobales bacterium]|nr:hypothetical protein [Terriglobales bacterium]